MAVRASRSRNRLESTNWPGTASSHSSVTIRRSSSTTPALLASCETAAAALSGQPGHRAAWRRCHEVMAAHPETFEPPEEDENAIHVWANSRTIDLVGLSTVVRRLLKQ